MHVSIETTVNLSGCCGWFSMVSFIYVFWFGWLRCVSLKDSLCRSLICGCGGKFSFGIWVHTAWKSRSQHFISEWCQLTHTSHNGRTHIHKCSLTKPLTHTHTRTHWHTLHLPNQSEWSGVGPPEVGGRAVETEVRLRTHKVWRTFWLTVSQP